MATRSLISYDDIVPNGDPSPRSNKPPPSKKRKGNKQTKSHNYNDNFVQSRVTNAVQPSSSALAWDGVGNESMDVEAESRDLSHDEIWDDSALIDAWNAATEEYEAYNGPDKGWKRDPIHKSPLWYNVPKAKTDANQNPSTSGQVPSLPGHEIGEEKDSRPLNFDAFMPSHDPTLKTNLGPGSEHAPGLEFLSTAPDALVNQDEAFTRALGAMYWTGYWTAMYHARRAQGQVAEVKDDIQQGEVDLSDENDDDEDERDWEEDEDDACVSTQR